jgi:WD40 repeat protein
VEPLAEDADDVVEEAPPPRGKKTQPKRSDPDDEPRRKVGKKTRQPEGSGKLWLWLGVGGGAVVLAGVVVLVIVLTANKKDDGNGLVKGGPGPAGKDGTPGAKDGTTGGKDGSGPPGKDGAAPPKEVPSPFTLVGTIPTGIEGRNVEGIETLMAISPDGSLVALSPKSPSPLVRIFDVKTGKPVSSYDRKGDPGRMAFSPDNAWIASADPTRSWMELRDLKTGRLVRNLKPDEKGNRFYEANFAFTPRGDALVCCSHGWVIGWDCKSGTQLYCWEMKGTSVDKTSVLLGLDRIVTTHENLATKQPDAKVWDGSKKEAIQAVKLEGRVREHALSVDGKLGAMLEYITVRPTEPEFHLNVYDLEKGRKLYRYQDASLTGGSERVAFSKDSKTLVIAKTWADQLWLVDAASGTPRAVVRAWVNQGIDRDHWEKSESVRNDIYNLVVSTSGSLALHYEDGTVKVLKWKE